MTAFNGVWQCYGQAEFSVVITLYYVAEVLKRCVDVEVLGYQRLESFFTHGGIHVETYHVVFSVEVETDDTARFYVDDGLSTH